ncbi:MAG: acetyl-CoA C-acetyltransferase [Chloroflexi bacterium]|nr:acetyl-CoA C-acetyltransferase [Chloroflexota bacterium]
MESVVLAGAARTPIGKFGGAFAATPATKLGAVAVHASIDRAGLTPDQIEYTIMGNALSAGVGQTPARQAAIEGGIPDTASALTINKACASGMMSIVLAAQAIKSGDAKVVVAGGMENMSLAPHLLVNSRTGYRMGDVPIADHMLRDGLWCPFEDRHMGSSAEAIAEKHHISRQTQDAFAARSHQRALSAAGEGAFAGEIVPVEVQTRKETVLVTKDEGPRAGTTAETLGGLRPAFPPGKTVTAGNSSQISDGAASVVVLSESWARELGVKSQARLTGYAHAAIDPAWLFDAPTLAVRSLLEKTGTRLEDYDLIEVNEAFAAQALANGGELGWDWTRVNVNVGAIALGHPIGASGARIVVTLLHALQTRRAQRGLAVICHAGGGAVALAVEAA